MIPNIQKHVIHIAHVIVKTLCHLQAHLSTMEQLDNNGLVIVSRAQKVQSLQCACFFACDSCICNELRGNMARYTQFPIMITRSTIIYDIISPGAAGSSIYV